MYSPNYRARILVLIVIIFVIGGIVYSVRSGGKKAAVGELASVSPSVTAAPAVDYKNIAYTINGASVQLQNGSAISSAPTGSASKVTTTFFGDQALGDVNGDGLPDVAFILTQQTGGSGTFYYVVVALRSSSGYTGTTGYLLGDRIAPQNLEIKNGQVVANYATRKAGQPMTTPPSVGVSKYLKLSGTALVETTPAK